MAGIASIAGAVAFPDAASAQFEATDENPDLKPIRVLVDTYDAALTNHDLAGVMAAYATTRLPRRWPRFREQFAPISIPAMSRTLLFLQRKL